MLDFDLYYSYVPKAPLEVRKAFCKCNECCIARNDNNRCFNTCTCRACGNSSRASDNSPWICIVTPISEQIFFEDSAYQAYVDADAEYEALTRTADAAAPPSPKAAAAPSPARVTASPARSPSLARADPSVTADEDDLLSYGVSDDSLDIPPESEPEPESRPSASASTDLSDSDTGSDPDTSGHSDTDRSPTAVEPSRERIPTPPWLNTETDTVKRSRSRSPSPLRFKLGPRVDYPRFTLGPKIKPTLGPKRPRSHSPLERRYQRPR
ncbi:MAG: hypothetical protein J3K34DRAFT_474611 [Monoraphidium minutum]|nr:MAG: hypothetical protein J3K34DRAFT_474611 [Monoraphidium minutum]